MPLVLIMSLLISRTNILLSSELKKDNRIIYFLS